MTLQEYEARVEQARIALRQTEGELLQTERELLSAYLSEISQGYHKLSVTERKFVLQRLDGITRSIRKNMKKYQFDPHEAKRVRKKAGLSCRILAAELGYAAQTSIANIEGGKYIPRGTTEGSMKYLLWLKEKGYNPYDL